MSDEPKQPQESTVRMSEDGEAQIVSQREPSPQETARIIADELGEDQQAQRYR
jgi:hypothetical protein